MKRPKLYKSPLIERNLHDRRAIRKIRSKLKKKILRGGTVNKYLSRKYRVVKGFNAHAKKAQRSHRGERIEIAIPEVFSIEKNCEKTLVFLASVKRQLSFSIPRDIYISHEKTIEIDLTASSLFDIEIEKYVAHWRDRRVKIGFFGNISHNIHVNNFLLAMGIVGKLGISKQNFDARLVDLEYDSKHYRFSYTGNYNNAKKQSIEKSNGAIALADHFNNCLKYCENEMTQVTYSNMIAATGEILGNAEEHSGHGHGKWHVFGFFDKNSEECSFSIINEGQSFYESLTSEESFAKEALKDFGKVVEKQRKLIARAVGSLFEKFEMERVFIVLALQDGISAKRPTEGKGNTRGQGLMHVITFVDEVKDRSKPAILNIVSGHSHIIIDGTYPILKRKIGAMQEPRRILTFNKQKDLTKAPDPSKVQLMTGNAFQGTIFSGRFRIDRANFNPRV